MSHSQHHLSFSFYFVRQAVQFPARRLKHGLGKGVRHRPRAPRRVPACIIEPLNKFRVDVQLDAPFASGSFGDVFIGNLEATGKPVVLKRARDSATAKTLFLKERQINRKLDKNYMDYTSRRWPKFLGDFVKDSESYLVWELEGAGLTLADYLSGKPLPELCAALNVSSWSIDNLQIPLFKLVTQELLLALRDIHSQGVVHRDVKPSNVLVVPNAMSPGTPIQLIDFGSACETGKLLWSPGVHTLDPLYAAPETRLSLTAPLKFDVFSTAMVGISLLIPSYTRESRLREFRNLLENANYDFKRLRSDVMSNLEDSFAPRDDELCAIFKDSTVQITAIFDLLCGMFEKSPNRRVSVEKALEMISFV